MRELNQDEVLEAILSCGLDLKGRISMTFDSGPLDVTRPTQVAERFASAIQRKFMEVNSITADAAPAAEAPEGTLQAFVSLKDVEAMERAAEEFDQNAEWLRSCGQDSMADSAGARAHELRAVRRRLYAPASEAGEPLPADEWKNEAALVMARFINLSAKPDTQSWAEAASRAIRLLNSPATESEQPALARTLPPGWRTNPELRPGEWDFHDWTMHRHESEKNQFCAFKAGTVAFIRRLDAEVNARAGGKLWAVHVSGADDVYAAPSQAEATEAAQRFNTWFEQRRDQHPLDPQMQASVIEWTYGAQKHLDGLRNWPEFVKSGTAAA